MVLAVCIGAVWVTRRTMPSPRFSSDKRILDRSKGDPKAPLWIVEYSDFQCRKCRDSALLIDGYLAKYPSEIFFQARFYPLIRNHLFALKAAIYADCAASQKRFWEFYGLLFEKQSEWSASEDPDELFRAYARQAGLDLGQLEACVGNPETKKRVMEEKDRAEALGVNATPTFFVNGKKIVGTTALKEELEAYFSKPSVKKGPA